MNVTRYDLESGSPWYTRLAARIESLKAGMDARQVKSYNPDLLRRIAWHIDNISQTCGDCESRKPDVEHIVSELETLGPRMSMADRRTFVKSRQAVTQHLKKVHRLAEPGHYTAIGGFIGTGLGVVIGIAADFPGSYGIGLALGLAIGWWLERKAKSEGKIL